MTDFLHVTVDDEYEGESKHSTTDERVGNITAVGIRHEVEPALLASAVLVKIFEHKESARMVNMCDVQSFEHLVARAIVMAGIALVPIIKQYEPETEL